MDSCPDSRHTQTAFSRNPKKPNSARGREADAVQFCSRNFRKSSQVKSLMLTDAGSDEPLCPYHS